MKTEPRARSFGVLLALVALAGLVWRVAYVVWMRNRGVGGDGPYYHYGAIYLADGLGYINPLIRLQTGGSVPNALHPPAWTSVLAVPSVLGLRSYLSHQLVACLVGTATIVMTGLAGRAAFGRRVGLIAAALVAIYPNTWLYERELEAETLASARRRDDAVARLPLPHDSRPGLGRAARSFGSARWP